MGFNINDIRSALNGGGVRPTQFHVTIFNKIDPSADRKLTFTCKAASLPASKLGKIDVPYYGLKYKVAGDRTFDPWTVTIINDEDFLVRNALENWSQAINDHRSNLRSRGATSEPASYKSQAQVIQEGKDGKAIRVIQFEGIYPTELSQMETSWETNDTLQEFTVTFEYDLWVPVPVGTALTVGEASPRVL